MNSDSSFRSCAAFPENPIWGELTRRQSELYKRNDDVRSPFARDYTRILHSMAYRRLKHKTQVFYNIDNDHICTRMEHVAHVESVSGTIALSLGLNAELTKAIAMGHDLGHAPFGHQGEKVLSRLTEKYLGQKFWHERNGLRFVDKVELLADNYNIFRNLNLTYAVRDGIISHCGEVDENGIKPRGELIDLDSFTCAGQYSPATWEGCAVKISDKIAYIGRDIEDAAMLGFLSKEAKEELREFARINDDKAINTTVIMHNLIIDICENSSPEKGICLSDRFLKQLDSIKDFNYRHIYGNKRFRTYTAYSELVINQIFETLLDCYDGEMTWKRLRENAGCYPLLISAFEGWLARYCEKEIIPQGELKNAADSCDNEKIYGRLDNKELYISAIIDYISGMTDRFAVKSFGELLTY